HAAGETVSRVPKRRRARRAADAKPAPRPLSRRRFMSLIAAGSALALAAPARGLAAPAKKPATAPAAPSRAIAAEIEKQKKNTAATLKIIRDYKLPPGSPMAFEFRPLRRRGK